MSGWAPDPLHIVLLAGFSNTVVGLLVYTLTKYAESKRYKNMVTKEDVLEMIRVAVKELVDQRSEKFTTKEQTEAMIKAMFQEVIIRCDRERINCPFVAKIENSLEEIKSIQRQRTEQLRSKARVEFELWRTVLTKLDVPVDKQNELLRGLAQ